jgi:hypothetical protein
MMLLNCTHCDDIVVLLNERARSCLCGRSTGRLTTDADGVPVITGPSRLAEIPWEAYDGAAGGGWQRWRLLPKGSGR